MKTLTVSPKYQRDYKHMPDRHMQTGRLPAASHQAKGTQPVLKPTEEPESLKSRGKRRSTSDADTIAVKLTHLQ